MEVPFSRDADDPKTGGDAVSFIDELRRVLRTELLRDSCSAATIACLFSMHRRTLHRHLRAEGVAFRQVADEIRFEIACKLLMTTDMALSQVAAALQYSELSAFTRAFRRWSGQTPSAWRSRHSYPRTSRRPGRSSQTPPTANPHDGPSR
jgi:AraC-like DNA-binding protein